jgi:prepilin-type N-terminal cleavage/methylation domain-containing protein
MPKFKRILKKKGFTIVELVIVIAVISILAAVTIPAFSSIVRKAQISAASQLSANFNKAVVGYEAVNAPITLMHDAVTAVEDYGFEQSDLVDDDGRYYVVWDSEIKRFVVFDGKEGSVCSEEGNTTPLTKLWKVVDEIPSEQLTSLYLTDEFDEKTVSVTVGIDVGDNEDVEEIIYTDTDEQVKDIIIRVNDPQTIVNLDNKGNDNVTVIGLNEDADAETPPPTEPDEPNVPETPKDTDAPKPTDEADDPNAFDPDDIVVQDGKVVYSMLTGEQYDSLNGAMTLGGELVLLADVCECAIKVKKDVVLDLNGFTIGYLKEYTDNTVIIDGGSLTVKDTSEDKSGAIINATKHDYHLSAIRIEKGALILEDGTIQGSKSAIYLNSGTSATINGGNVIGIDTAGMGIYISTNCSLEINDGYISTEAQERYAIIVKSSAKEYSIVINGGQIDRDISEPGNGNIVVNGGNISGK